MQRERNRPHGAEACGARSRRAAALFAASLLAAAPAFAVPQDTPPVPEEEVELTRASEAVVRQLLAAHERAGRDGDALAVAAALAAMSAHDNEEFRAPATLGLSYRLSRADKDAVATLARELDLSGKKELAALLSERRGRVLAAAAHVLANLPAEKKTTKALAKLFGDDEVQDDMPMAFAAIIEALGRLGHAKVEAEVVGLLEKARTREVARAAVRYLGHLPTTSYRGTRKLCELLSAPAPAAVDDASNPPADYWQSQWERWDWTRRDISWALKRVTGQVFRPEDGEHPGDRDAALAYVKEHRRELGLR